MDKMEIAKFIYNYLNDISLLGMPPDSDEFLEYRYLDDHLDSFGIIQFIMAVENEFGITLNPEDTEGEEFRTINGLIGIISSKTKV